MTDGLRRHRKTITTLGGASVSGAMSDTSETRYLNGNVKRVRTRNAAFVMGQDVRMISNVMRVAETDLCVRII